MHINVIVGVVAIVAAVPLLAWTFLSDADDTPRVGLGQLIEPRRRGEAFDPDLLRRSAGDRLLRPVLDRVLGIARRLTPVGWAQDMELKLGMAAMGQPWTPERVLTLKGIGMVAGAVISIKCSTAGLGSMLNLIGFIGAMPLLFFMPDILIRNKADKRQNEITRTLPDILDQITVGVEAGLGFDSAMARCASSNTGALPEELTRTLQQIQAGLSRAEALRGLGNRNKVPELRQFVSAVLQADQFGIPMAQVLRVQSAEQRRKRRQRAEEKAMKLPVKVLFPLVLCILPALFIVIIGPAALQIKDANFG